MRHFVLLLTVILAATAGAATIHVPADRPTIQAGIDLAALSDTVVVAPGTYNESLVITRGVCLKSESGPEVTVIHPATAGSRLISASGSVAQTLTISGFTLSGALAVDRAISITTLRCNIENNWITNNRQCANLVIGSTWCKVIGNRIWNNSGPGCSGVWISGDIFAEVAGNEIYSNSGSECSGVRTEGGDGPSLIHHNLIYDNRSISAAHAAALNINGTWLIFNNTVVSNYSSRQTAAIWAGGFGIEIRNNIVASNLNCSGIRGATQPSYNDTWNNEFSNFESSSPGPGNFSSNPAFLDELSRDYRLSPGSPCVDAGDPSAEYNDTDGSRNDVGALALSSWTYPIPVALNFGEGPGLSTITTLTPTFYWTYYDAEATTQGQYELEVGTDADWQEAELWQPGQAASSDTSVQYGGVPLQDHARYFIRIRLNNGTVWGDWVSTSFATRISHTIRVPLDRPTIQLAIDEAIVGDTVLVSPGTYYESLFINKAINLRSSDGPLTTIIHPAAPTKRILDATGGGTSVLTISGFTLSGATNTDYAINIYGFRCLIENNTISDNHQCSNLVLNQSSSRILSNRIWGNSGGSCSGIWVGNGSAVEIAHNEIFDNSNSECSGIRTEAASSASSIHHNLLYGNSSTSGSYAIALNINGSWNVYNNTIVANSATQITAAVWLGGGSVTFRSNIVASNQACYGLRNATAPSFNDVLDNSLGNFQNCSPGTGNLSLDPLFVDPLSDDYHLSTGSPCVNAGDPASQFNDPDGTRNDIGAFNLGTFDYPVAYAVNYGDGIVNHVVNELNPTFFWSYLDTASSIQNQMQIEVGIDEDWTSAELWQPGAISSQDTSIQYSGAPLVDHRHYYLRIRLHNGISWGSWIPSSFFVRTKGTILVPQELGTIQAGIDVASAGDTVLVSAGTYTENLAATKPLTLLSVSGPDSTFVVSSSAGNPVLSFSTLSGDSLVVSGFSFSGSSQAECGICLYDGLFRFENNRVYDNQSKMPLRVLRAGGVVRGNRIDQNVGSDCGGLAIQSDSLIVVEDNLIAGNESARCAGIRTEPGTRGAIRRNIFRGNSSGTGLEASAINSNGYWEIHNNTVALNSSSVSTAALWVGAQSTDVRNNLVAFNSGNYGIRGAYEAAYNCSFGNQYGNFQSTSLALGNFSTDPMFVNSAAGDLSLQSASPCRDAGDPANGFMDADGTRNDIGAIAFVAATRLVGVKFGNEADLEHIVNNQPVATWEFRSSDASPQTEFEIEYGTDNDWTIAELWDPDPILSGDSSIAYAGVPLQDGARYWMRVRARNSSGWTNWAELPFRLNSPPSSPTMYYPEDRATIEMPTVGLVILNSTDNEADSLYYVFEVSLDSLFTTQVTTIVIPSDLVYYTRVTSDTLAENGRYYWRVTASDYRENSAPTPRRVFVINTANSAPPAFNLASPGDGYANPVGTLYPRLRWEPALDPDPGDVLTYTLYLSLDANFHFVYVVPGVSATEYTITDALEWNEYYWWKAKVTDKLGVEAWCSQVFRFKTMTPGDPNADGSISISDAIVLINFIFAGGRAPNPLPSGDANCSGSVTISDAVYLIKYIFAGGPAPCEPDLLLKDVVRTPAKFGPSAPERNAGPVD